MDSTHAFVPLPTPLAQGGYAHYVDLSIDRKLSDCYDEMCQGEECKISSPRMRYLNFVVFPSIATCFLSSDTRR